MPYIGCHLSCAKGYFPMVKEAEKTYKDLGISESTLVAVRDGMFAVANESAKTVVAELLSATVHSIDPEFTVVVVQ